MANCVLIDGANKGVYIDIFTPISELCDKRITD